MPVLIMVVIGLFLDNTIWLYTALGFATLSLLVKSISAQAEAVKQQNQQTEQALELLKSLRAKMN